MQIKSKTDKYILQKSKVKKEVREIVNNKICKN